MNFDEILQERRDVVARSIRPIPTEEASALGESLFPFHDDPWREPFFRFLAEHPDATLHHAELPEGGQLLYSRSHDRGIWFFPGKGMGIIQERGLKTLADILANRG